MVKQHIPKSRNSIPDRDSKRMKSSVAPPNQVCHIQRICQKKQEQVLFFVGWGGGFCLSWEDHHDRFFPPIRSCSALFSNQKVAKSHQEIRKKTKELPSFHMKNRGNFRASRSRQQCFSWIKNSDSKQIQPRQKDFQRGQKKHLKDLKSSPNVSFTIHKKTFVFSSN